MELAVDAKEISKYYQNGAKKALAGLNLNVPAGCTFGILGPNGAGKSTFLKAVVGLISIDYGKLLIFGTKPIEASRNVGYVPEDVVLYHYLTGGDFLYLIGGLRGLTNKDIKKQIEKYYDLFQLPDLRQLIFTYSKGNKEKMLLMSSILHRPKMLVLDEPFTGLDPLVTINVKAFIKEYVAEGNTVILSTHLLESANALCQEIAVLVCGRIVDLIKVSNVKDDLQLEEWYKSVISNAMSVVSG